MDFKSRKDWTYKKVMGTINMITRMRDQEHYHVRLVLNVCITPQTFDSLIDIVEYMLALKPNDIKLIPIAQLKDQWETYEKKYEQEMKGRLLSMIPSGEDFAMLRSRVKSLVKKSFRGYNDKRQVPPCYLSQDERTVDPEGNYYGCYINYREGAIPIGNIKQDSFRQQSEKLRENMMNFTNSDICQKYCADITVMCNKYIDAKIHESGMANYVEMGCVNVTRDRFGNKAYVLERMYEEGINVPKAYYINSEFLQRIFIEEHQKEYTELIEKLNSYNRNTGIRQWILGQKENAELLGLCEKLHQQFERKTVVVRSSTNVEDGTNKSYAGAFETVMDVTNVTDLFHAIRQVYSSKFNYLVDFPESVTMGIIVQEQIQAEYAGVAFTVNPLTGEEEYVINYTNGACENVVSGKDVKEVIFDKTEEKRIGELTGKMSAQLLNSIKKIEALFEEATDIEWVINGNEVYILQARPITTIKKTKITHQNLYVDSLDQKMIEEYDMSSIRQAHKKYMEKHYYVRKKALEMGILFPQTGYLFYDKATLSQEIFEKEVFSSRIYKVVSDKAIKTLAKENVVDYLKTCGEGEDNIVRLQQITITDACGNASLTEEGYVYIEFLPGGFGGFLSGELPFSTYLVDLEGKVQYKDEKMYSAKWEFNEEQKKFLRKPCEKFRYFLPEKVILQLANMVIKVQQTMANARVEWEMEKETVYLNDISFEGNALRGEILLQNKISAGTMSGEIRIIQDLEELQTILRGRSIVPEREFYEATRSDELQKYLAKHHIDNTKRYIFVSESAHPTLSLLLPYSSGFVFEKGGMLSHMAIILRENHVPGVIEANAMKKYREGEKYLEG